MVDFLFAFTDWLRTTFLLDLSFWITETPLSLFMVENFWMVPIAQVFHILAISAAFGATLMLCLRVNERATCGLTVAQAAARYIPWVWWGLLVIAISGTFMLLAEPLRNMVNAVYWIKMGLLLLAILLTLRFHGGIRRQALAGGAGWRASGGARANAWLIVLLWCLIMVCGRWIAYVPV